MGKAEDPIYCVRLFGSALSITHDDESCELWFLQEETRTRDARHGVVSRTCAALSDLCDDVQAHCAAAAAEA